MAVTFLKLMNQSQTMNPFLQKSQQYDVSLWRLVHIEHNLSYHT